MKKTLAIDLIEAEAGTQMRSGTRMETVNEYADIFEGSKSWPFDSPLIVFQSGDDYYLADGFHRLAAAVKAGRASVSCDVKKGSLRVAIKYALGANQSHGLRRTNDDKRTAVEFVLADKEWSGLSSRLIAEMVGVGHTLVDKIRNAQVASDATCESDGPTKTEENKKRIGKDGKKQSATKPKPDEVYEDVKDDPEPEKPAIDQWKMDKNVIVKTLEKMQRHVDELNDLKPSRWRHNAIKEIQQATATMRGWDK